MQKPQDISQEDWDKLAQDEQRILETYSYGNPFSFDFIRSLNFESNKESCRNYNENLKLLKWYQEQTDSFHEYIRTMRKWYE